MEYGVKNLSMSYSELKVLNNITIEFGAGKVTCILGPSGCGKTTLLNIISGVTKSFDGEVIGFEDKHISYIFQEGRLIEWKTVRNNLKFVLNNKLSPKESELLIVKYLRAFGMENYIDYYPNKLSGGMRQRIGIIRALIYPSDIMIMDEPFKSMDEETKQIVMNCFVELMQQEKRTVILVTHDRGEAIYLGDKIIILSAKPTSVVSTNYRD